MFAANQQRFLMVGKMPGAVRKRSRAVQRTSIPLLAVLLTGLAGCGIAAKVNARNDMEASKRAYKACLVQRPENPAACEATREAYQADLAAYQATSAGIRPGPTFTIEQPTDFGPPPSSANFGGTPQFGQPVIGSGDCIGAVVAGVCHGVPAPGAPMATCYGQMIGGVCTGPMF